MKRIQRKGIYDYSWKKNPNAIYIGRPSRWGNPYRLRKEDERNLCLIYYEEWLNRMLKAYPDFLKPLIGKDLICWCPLDKPCHVDILIKYIKKLYGEQ